MKTTIYTIIGSAFIASLAWFCFSCSEKSDATEKDKPEQTAAVNPDLAGKGHNDCLDIFYDKWQALKNRKAKQTRAGGEDDDLPPNPGDDDEITREELEEAIANSIAQSWDILLENEDNKEELIDEMNSFLAECEEIIDEDIEEIILTEDETNLFSMIDNVLYNNDYTHPNDLINAINNIEIHAREILPDENCSRFLKTTSILRNSLEYWAANYSNWNQSETRGKIHWTDVVDIAVADYTWGAAANGFGGGFGFARSPFVSAAARIIGCYTWQVQLAFTVGAAALGSIVEVCKKCDDDVAEDTNNTEIESDYCRDILEKAYDIFSATEEDNTSEEIVP